MLAIFVLARFNTASGRCCCNVTNFVMIAYKTTIVSIPQAVGVVATVWWVLQSENKTVSIPQAVGVVAWLPLFYLRFAQVLEMCGPHRRFAPLLSRTLRRIPQAVGVVATAGLKEPVFMGFKIRFWKTSYRKRSKRTPIWSTRPMDIGKYWKKMIFLKIQSL